MAALPDPFEGSCPPYPYSVKVKTGDRDKQRGKEKALVQRYEHLVCELVTQAMEQQREIQRLHAALEKTQRTRSHTHRDGPRTPTSKEHHSERRRRGGSGGDVSRGAAQSSHIEPTHRNKTSSPAPPTTSTLPASVERAVQLTAAHYLKEMDARLATCLAARVRQVTYEHVRRSVDRAVRSELASRAAVGGEHAAREAVAANEKASEPLIGSGQAVRATHDVTVHRQAETERTANPELVDDLLSTPTASSIRSTSSHSSDHAFVECAAPTQDTAKRAKRKGSSPHHVAYTAPRRASSVRLSSSSEYGSDTVRGVVVQHTSPHVQQHAPPRSSVCRALFTTSSSAVDESDIRLAALAAKYAPDESVSLSLQSITPSLRSPTPNRSPPRIDERDEKEKKHSHVEAWSVPSEYSPSKLPSVRGQGDAVVVVGDDTVENDEAAAETESPWSLQLAEDEGRAALRFLLQTFAQTSAETEVKAHETPSSSFYTPQREPVEGSVSSGAVSADVDKLLQLFGSGEKGGRGREKRESD